MRTGPEWQRTAIALGAMAVVLAAGTGLVLSVTSAPATRASLTLTIEFNPSTWYVTVTPSTLQAPAGTIVQVTITNYDPSSHPVAASYCNVSGTVGKTMQETYPASATGSGAAVFWLSASQLSHTFTMMSDGYDINIPIPVALSAQSPAVVAFSFEALQAGVTPWSSESVGVGPHGSSGDMTGLFEST